MQEFPSTTKLFGILVISSLSATPSKVIAKLDMTEAHNFMEERVVCMQVFEDNDWEHAPPRTVAILKICYRC